MNSTHDSVTEELLIDHLRNQHRVGTAWRLVVSTGGVGSTDRPVNVEDLSFPELTELHEDFHGNAPPRVVYRSDSCDRKRALEVAGSSRKGLYSKFSVERKDGRDSPGGDKDDARYFVLDYVHDSYARIALEAYASACERDLPDLAADLRAQLASLDVV